MSGLQMAVNSLQSGGTFFESLASVVGYDPSVGRTSSSLCMSKCTNQLCPTSPPEPGNACVMEGPVVQDGSITLGDGVR